MMPMTRATSPPDRLFRLLGEETRLRIIRALSDAPLTVNELTEVLAMPQSTISRHLAVMREGGLVADRREGAYAWYRLSDALVNDGALIAAVRASLGRVPHEKADVRRLERALDGRRARARDFFDAVAGSYHGMVEPGGGADGLALAFMMALPPSAIVDVGAGQGEVAVRLARLGHRVHAIDASRKMIRALSQRLTREGVGGVTPVVGDVESVPLEDACADVVLLSQILHHAARPEVAVGEAARLARPGGRVVVLDLSLHDMEWTRSRLGDLWLGFTPDALERWMGGAGLVHVKSDTVAPNEGLALVVCVGTRAADRG
jgi:ArsR family transcriptional regulator